MLKLSPNISTKYTKAIEKFLKLWQNRKDTLGALLVGSYATNLQTSNSDIDICIILNEKAPYWKRGNVVISGFLIEYGIYPLSYFQKIQIKDLQIRKRIRTRMLSTGKVLFDKSNGHIAKLQEEARLQLKQKLPQLSESSKEFYKYLLWDQLDNLQYLYKTRSRGLTYAYYVGLQNIIEYYAAALCLEIPRTNNIYRFLTNSSFHKKYQITPLPDPVFLELFKNAMGGLSLINFEKLTSHVQEITGGFSINGWTLSGPV